MIRAAVVIALGAVLVLAGTGCGSHPTASTSQTPVPSENYGDILTSDGAPDIDPALQSLTAWA
ncbi:MAG TPA: hypothetical protein PL146_10235, partial [Mycobacterium sp.]|nr:hypothetical protein [Mycobacterium sp.]